MHNSWSQGPKSCTKHLQKKFPPFYNQQEKKPNTIAEGVLVLRVEGVNDTYSIH